MPLSANYAFSEKYSAGLNYSYSYSEIKKNSAQMQSLEYRFQNPGRLDIHNFGANLRGDISAKLTLFAAAGLSVLETYDRVLNIRTNNMGVFIPQSDDYTRTNFYFSLSANYQASSRLNVYVSAGRHYEIGGQGQNLVDTFVLVNARYQLTTKWFLGASVRYAYHEFEKPISRQDHVMSGGIRLVYAVNQICQVGLSYMYMGDISHGDNRIPGYRANIISLAATFRY